MIFKLVMYDSFYSVQVSATQTQNGTRTHNKYVGYCSTASIY